MRISRTPFVVVVGLAIFALGLTSPVDAASVSRVRTVPAGFTPWLLPKPVFQRVQKLRPCNGLMYAVGKISAIGQGSHTYHRGNAFSFNAATGAVTSWDPHVNGMVHAIAMSPDCSTAYLGGTFTKVNGVAARNLVAVDARSGAVRAGFAHTAAGVVQTLQYTHGQVIAGGRFLKINGVARTRLASLNPSTGSVTSYLRLRISGSYPRTATEVYNSQLSHAGNRMLVEGVFTSVGGAARRQVAMLNLGAASVSVAGWFPPELNRACAISFYVRAAAWSPSDATVYLATTGDRPVSGPGSGTRGPRSGPCDAVTAFPSTGGSVGQKWVNYTGCDSLYSVVADTNEVYFGGHERWANNGSGCDFPGPGAVSRPGLGSVNAATGRATSWNPTRSLGAGADDMLLTGAGLWVASDTWTNGQAQRCGGRPRHGGICFLPR